jgi:hypothetical protein
MTVKRKKEQKETKEMGVAPRWNEMVRVLCSFHKESV